MSHLEIEKRYLCNAKELIKYLKKEHISYIVQKLEQFYLIAKPGETLRFRKEDNKYIKNQKFGTGLIREEKEQEVSKKAYKKAKAKNSGGIIKKDRVKFIINSNLYELDIFKGKLNGLAILEIEFKDINQANSYKIPKALEPFIIKDITNESIYSNGALSRSMQIPLRSDSILSLNEIKQNRTKLLKPKLDLYISHFESSKDALVNSINRLLLSAKLNLDNFLNNNNIKDLKRVKKALIKAKALIVGYKKYIKKSCYESILFNINNILLTFEETLNLQTTIEELLKQKSRLPIQKQTIILKEIIEIAQKQKQLRENITNKPLIDLINNFDIKFNNADKPFYSLKNSILKNKKRNLKKALKSNSIKLIYQLTKEYKILTNYFKEPFKLKKAYKELKKVYKIEVCKNYTSLCKSSIDNKVLNLIKKAL